MAKKHKSAKKVHRFNPEHLGQAATPAATQASANQPPASVAAQAVGLATAQVVRRDVSRVLVLAVGFILLLVLLWWLFVHTGLGSSVYNAVKV